MAMFLEAPSFHATLGWRALAYRAASTTSSPELLMRKYKYSNSRERSLEKYGLWSPVSSNAVPAGH